MTTIPVINCPDEACAREKSALVKTFLHDGDWIHVDVTDGVFSEHATWNDAEAWKDLRDDFNLEVHLMVLHPENHIKEWFGGNQALDRAYRDGDARIRIFDNRRMSNAGRRGDAVVKTRNASRDD